MMFPKQAPQQAVENSASLTASRRPFLINTAGVAVVASLPLTAWAAETAAQSPI
jgi:hypothetical protein